MMNILRTTWENMISFLLVSFGTQGLVYNI